MDTTQFAEEVLQGLGLPATPANLEVLVAWENQEGGHWHNSASYNPLNTTMPMPGYRKTGRQGNIGAYVSWAQGVAATVKTLALPAYAGIRAALKQGSDPMAVADAVGASPWGTKGLAAALRGGAGGPVAPEPVPTQPAAGNGTTQPAGYTASGVSWNPFTWGRGIEHDIYKVSMFSLFGLAGTALVVIGLVKGVSPTVQKVQQMGAQAAGSVAKAAAVA